MSPSQRLRRYGRFALVLPRPPSTALPHFVWEGAAPAWPVRPPGGSLPAGGHNLLAPAKRRPRWPRPAGAASGDAQILSNRLQPNSGAAWALAKLSFPQLYELLQCISLAKNMQLNYNYINY
jgi:hypothetical protein